MGLDRVDRRAVLTSAAARLRAAGVDSSEHDAAELLAHVLGTTRSQMVLVPDLSVATVEVYDALVARRAEREPLQHLTGVAYFRHVVLRVGPGVFVPRPETELLAGWAIEQTLVISEGGTETVTGRVTEGIADGVGRRPIVVDLGTGSGAVAKSIAHEVPAARVYAVELDPVAHGWATENLAGTGVELRLGDLATAFGDLDGTADVVVCNPPYIPLEAWESVAPEARDHDPHLALFSGPDGLDAIRVLERRAAAMLRPGGLVGAEHADVQGDSAPSVFSATGRWTEVRDHRDLAGRPRFMTARLVTGSPPEGHDRMLR